MKTTTIKLAAITLLIGCTGCNDILDKGPRDKFSENDIWGSSELAQAFLYPTLNDATDKLISYDHWSDNDIIQDIPGTSNVNKEQIDNYYDAGWNQNVYSQIRKCNLMLQKMEENTSFIEQDRKYLTAQAKALRGIIYYTRARLFGKLMIVDKVIGENDNMELLSIPFCERMVDTGTPDVIASYKKYRELYEEWKKLKDDLDDYKLRKQERERRLDTLEWELNQINAANLHEGEDEEVTSKLNILQNHEKILRALQEALDIITADNGVQALSLIHI